jgi:protein-histidine pros-kinase
MFLAINVFLYLLVVRPVRRLAEVADQVSLGELNAPTFQTGGGDEIGTLGTSFNRLRRSLDEALGMLMEHPDRIP